MSKDTVSEVREGDNLPRKIGAKQNRICKEDTQCHNASLQLEGHVSDCSHVVHLHFIRRGTSLEPSVLLQHNDTQVRIKSLIISLPIKRSLFSLQKVGNWNTPEISKYHFLYLAIRFGSNLFFFLFDFDSVQPPPRNLKNLWVPPLQAFIVFSS